MAISYIGVNAPNFASGGTSLGVQTGDLFILWLVNGSGSATYPPVPTGFTGVVQLNATSSTKTTVAYRFAAFDEDWTASEASGFEGTKQMAVMVYRGASGIGNITYHSARNTVLRYPEITTSQAGSWIIRIANTQAQLAIPTGFTQRMAAVQMNGYYDSDGIMFGTIASSDHTVTRSYQHNASIELLATPEDKGKVKVWNGSEWLLRPVKYWDGTQWKDGDFKYWRPDSWDRPNPT